MGSLLLHYTWATLPHFHARQLTMFSQRQRKEIAKLRDQLEQLQREVNIERKPVSASIKEMMKYIEENLQDEFFLRNDPKYKNKVEKTKNPYGDNNCPFMPNFGNS